MKLHYLNVKSVKQKLNDENLQISPEALFFLDTKFDDYLDKLCKQFNGHHKRINKGHAHGNGLGPEKGRIAEKQPV